MASPLPNGRGRGRYRPLAEINVTPLVDVMLVLLIIFMVAAPLMTSGINVDLPNTGATSVNQDSTPLNVIIDGEGKVYLQDTEVALTDLPGKLSAIADGKMDRRIYVRGDQSLNYGRVIDVMRTITQGGFTKVALIGNGSDVPSGVGVRRPGGGTTGPASPAAGSARPPGRG